MASHSESALTSVLVTRAVLESCRRLEALVRYEQAPKEPSRAFHWSTFFDRLDDDPADQDCAPLITANRPRRPARIVGYSAHVITESTERALPPLALTVLGMAAMGTIGLSSAWLPGTSSEWALGESLLSADTAIAAPLSKTTAKSASAADRLQAFASVQPLDHGAMVLSKDWPMAGNPPPGSADCQLNQATAPRG